MKILVTGMNPADTNTLVRGSRVPIFQAFVEAMKFLQERGESLDWRRVMVGEKIPSDTDAVIVSSMLPRSMNCRYALGAMWTIGEALHKEIPLVIYLTDWAFFKASYEFASIARAGSDYFSKKIGGVLQYPEDPAMIERYSENLLWVCHAYGKRNSKLWRNAQVLVPKYAHWGNPRIIQRELPGAHPINGIDPTPLLLRYLNDDPRVATPPLDIARRHKHWILPTLSKDETWELRQNLTWPIDRFGPKKLPVLEDEREVQLAYRRRVGALCPPYPTVGSGWWRSRWIHSALARSVLLADPQDGNLLGPAYSFSGSSYEAMSTDSLRDAADGQRDSMELFMQKDIEWFANELYAPFNRAMGLL